MFACRCNAPWLLVVLMCAFGQRAHAADALPALRMQLDDQAYAAAAQPWLTGRDRTAVASDAPAFGLVITDVDAKQQGAAQGLRVGDLILEVSGVAIEDLRFRWDTDRPWSLRVRHPDWSIATIALQPGLAGINYHDSYPHWRAERMLADAERAHAAWADDLCIAAAACEDDPVLAEEALARAWRAGDHSPQCCALAALALFGQWRMADAAAFATAAMPQLPTADRPALCRVLVAAAAAAGDWPAVATAVQGQHPRDSNSAANIPGVRAAPIHAQPAHLLVETRAFADRSNELLMIRGVSLHDMDQGGTHRFRLPPNRFDRSHFGTEVIDAELSATITSQIAPPNGKPTPGGGQVDAQWQLVVHARTPDEYAQGSYDRAAIWVTVGDRYVEVDSDFGFDITVPLSQARHGLNRQTSVRIVVIGQEASVLVDDQLVCRMPIAEPRERRLLSGAVKVVGMRGTIDALRWHAIGSVGDHVDHLAAGVKAEQAGDLVTAERELRLSAELVGDSWSVRKLHSFLSEHQRASEAVAYLDARAQRSGDHTARFDQAIAMLRLDPIPRSEVARLVREHGAALPVLDRYGWCNWSCQQLRRNGFQVDLLAALDQHGASCEDQGLIGFLRFVCGFELGHFAEVDELGERLLKDKTYFGQYAIDIMIYQTVLRAMLRDVAMDASLAESALDRKGIEASSKLAYAYLAGQIPETEIDVRAASEKDGDMLYFARGLKRMALGDHDGAQADFKRIAERHTDWDEAGASHALLDWYASIDAAHRAALPKTQAWPNHSVAPPPPSAGANDF